MTRLPSGRTLTFFAALFIFLCGSEIAPARDSNPEQGTYSAFAPTGGDGGSGVLTIDGPGITVDPGLHRAVDIEATNVTVMDDNASINLGPGSSATLIGGADTMAMARPTTST